MSLADRFSADVRAHVDARLDRFLLDAQSYARAEAPGALALVDQIRALTMRGGKRVRAVLIAAGVECVAPWSQHAGAVADLGAAMEILQSYLLIHDDWMDGDTLRRGGPTVHVALAQRLGSKDHGAWTAVLAGDLASAYAQQLVASCDVRDDRRAAVNAAFAEMQRDVVLGQTLDVLGSGEIERIHRLKTSSYTVRGPLRLGHALAGGSSGVLEAFESFGPAAGVAFQLRDDLLGAFGNARETGKSSSSDLRSGKHTAPVTHAIEHLAPDSRAEFETLLGIDDDAAVARARVLMDSVDARGAVEMRIAELCVRAEAALDGRGLRDAGREILGQMLAAMAQRDR